MSTGLIDVACQELGRSIQFWEAFSALDLPEGWKINPPSRGSAAVKARNSVIKKVLREGYDYVLFVDDDHILPHDIVQRLLSHQKSLVSALYVRRISPFSPLIFDRLDAGRILQKGESGLSKTMYTGCGCLLVSRQVLEEMRLTPDDDLWFAYGQFGKPDLAQPDFYFFEKARQAGHPVYIDLDARIGHIGEVVVWPRVMSDGSWGATIVSDELEINLPGRDILAQIPK